MWVESGGVHWVLQFGRDVTRSVKELFRVALRSRSRLKSYPLLGTLKGELINNRNTEGRRPDIYYKASRRSQRFEGGGGEREGRDVVSTEKKKDKQGREDAIVPNDWD